MFIVTNKSTQVIHHWGKQLTELDNGYPLLVNEDIAFVPEEVIIYEVNTIPEDIAPYKYTYSVQDGFALSPDWSSAPIENPYNIPDDVYAAIKNEAIAEVQKEAQNG